MTRLPTVTLDTSEVATLHQDGHWYGERNQRIRVSGTVYAASRASVPARPAMWKRLRDEGHRIIATWIDEAGPGETPDMAELWPRVVREVTCAERLVLYAEPADLPLKGAFVEVGIAIGAGRPVYVVAPDVPDARLGSWTAHPLVTRCATVVEAMPRREPLDGRPHDWLGRTLPLPGHFTDCPHGRDGMSFCTCPDRRRPANGSTERWPEHPAEVAAPEPAFSGAFDTATADPLEPLVLDAQRVNFWSWARALERVVAGGPLDSLERASLAVLLGRFTDALGETAP